VTFRATPWEAPSATVALRRETLRSISGGTGVSTAPTRLLYRSDSDPGTRSNGFPSTRNSSLELGAGGVPAAVPHIGGKPVYAAAMEWLNSSRVRVRSRFPNFQSLNTRNDVLSSTPFAHTPFRSSFQVLKFTQNSTGHLGHPIRRTSWRVAVP